MVLKSADKTSEDISRSKFICRAIEQKREGERMPLALLTKKENNHVDTTLKIWWMRELACASKGCIAQDTAQSYYYRKYAYCFHRSLPLPAQAHLHIPSLYIFHMSSTIMFPGFFPLQFCVLM
jgi:hypothetical protein